ncbi:MASE1 domain-containing protein [Geomonas sp. Red32]|uniref:MASE1 domain-containing protein n=1 Tax=Geomonas sp. Red32 TaxID=2912856 RepID=UPI00202D033C|nr:MASE1 domain-containing protein [Geomonas sp. Red32]MCM0082195.1 MASE1 domain-containing protein [Geomonas sp. Red32]
MKPLNHLIVAGAYLLTAKVGLLLAIPHTNATPVWPPSGIALAACLIYGYRIWPGIFAGALLANAAAPGDHSLLSSVLFSVTTAGGNTLEALAASWLIRCGSAYRFTFDRLADTLRFILFGALASPLISATVGTFALNMMVNDWPESSEVWLTWWVGDVVGALLFTPLILNWPKRPLPRWSGRKAMEAAAALLGLALVEIVSFRLDLPLEYLFIPILFWTAFRLGSFEAAVALVLVMASAVLWTLNGYGHFAAGHPERALLFLQMYIGVTAAATLVVAAMVATRNRTVSALRNSEEEYRHFFESAPIGIFRSSVEGRFLRVNPELASMFGYPTPEGMLSGVSDIASELFVHPEERFRIVETVRTASGFVRDEVEYRRKDGTRYFANLYMRTVRDENGEIRCVEGFVEDITARKLAYDITRNLNLELEQRVHERTVELERANSALQKEVESRKKGQLEIACLNAGLMRQRAALETANKELESFSFSVSHDLRAPLRNITAMVALLLAEGEGSLGQRGVQYAEKIGTCSAKMQELVEGLLTLAQISRGELRTVPIDLSIYVRELAQELAQTEPERAVTFVIADSAPAVADPVLIRSVLQNLVTNAWKYTSKRSEAVIEFGVQGQREDRAFFVRDNGAGFDMAHAEKLFGAFQRMHTTSQFEGTGIGLATVQRIIHRHGGEVWAEAEVDRGATFYFTLPLPCQVTPEG